MWAMGRCPLQPPAPPVTHGVRGHGVTHAFILCFAMALADGNADANLPNCAIIPPAQRFTQLRRCARCGAARWRCRPR